MAHTGWTAGLALVTRGLLPWGPSPAARDKGPPQFLGLWVLDSPIFPWEVEIAAALVGKWQWHVARPASERGVWPGV